MTKYLITALMIGVIFSGCRHRESVFVISVGVFEALDRDSTPTESELTSLKAYTDSIYHPEQRPRLLDKEGLERIGYALRLAVNDELKVGHQHLFNQGIQGIEAQEALAIMAETHSLDRGGYNLSVNFRYGTNKWQTSTEQSVFVAVPSAGTVILSNGLIVSWTTKPKKE